MPRFYIFNLIKLILVIIEVPDETLSPLALLFLLQREGVLVTLLSGCIPSRLISHHTAIGC